MSDSKSSVREMARALGLSIPEDRLEKLAAAWEEALAEVESIRQTPAPVPPTPPYDAAWSQKK